MTVDVDPDPAGLAELARALVDLPPLGPWVTDAACGPLVDAEVWTADAPDVEELAVAVRVCRRCPVRRECASYAASAPVHGLWGGHWRQVRSGRRAA